MLDLLLVAMATPDTSKEKAGVNVILKLFNLNVGPHNLAPCTCEYVFRYRNLGNECGCLINAINVSGQASTSLRKCLFSHLLYFGQFKMAALEGPTHYKARNHLCSHFAVYPSNENRT